MNSFTSCSEWLGPFGSGIPILSALSPEVVVTTIAIIAISSTTSSFNIMILTKLAAQIPSYVLSSINFNQIPRELTETSLPLTFHFHFHWHFNFVCHQILTGAVANHSLVWYFTNLQVAISSKLGKVLFPFVLKPSGHGLHLFILFFW